MSEEQTVARYETPFPHFVIDGIQHGLLKGYYDPDGVRPEDGTVRAGAVLEPYMLELDPAWLSDDWKSYDNDLERKVVRNDVAAWPYPLQRTFLDLMSPFGTRMLQEVTLGHWQIIPDLVADRTLHGGGIHVMRAGGSLAPHLDYSLHPKLTPPMERRLNLVLFLNREWKPSWGGAFQLWNDDATEVAAKVYPAYGRAVVWESAENAYHGTERVADDCPVDRVTAAIYYLSPARISARRKRALFVPNRGGVQ